MKRKLLFYTLLLFNLINLKAQVQIRDTIINWQHHTFELNEGGGILSHTTNDADIQQVEFSNSKVIENELIKLVVVPEYGGRVLSFQYKLTGYEYLYQSECGSAYGIGDGNFYYDWLMVWGGIFPTFPEPEHGKTWFLPWKYTLIKETNDTVIIQMEFTDSTEYSMAPSNFSKGVTGITCLIEVGVYSGSSLWDFNVTLKNNKSTNVDYEYWTCTTLTPGSEPGNTESPLNSEMVVPFNQYEAAWSPGGWIGNYGSLYDMSRIDYLSKWTDMGIAYAHNLQDNYWGVINQDNKEGIMRISDNMLTPGMKFWTWGRDNIDNDLFDYSNGGNDNYIELWAGVSEAFFSSASLQGYQEISWNEAYVPTTGLSSVDDINRFGVMDIIWDNQENLLTYNLNSFRPHEDYEISLTLSGNNTYSITDKAIYSNPLGNSESFDLNDFGVEEGNYTATFSLMDDDRNQLLEAVENIVVSSSSFILEQEMLAKENIKAYVKNRNQLIVEMKVNGQYSIKLIDLNGRIVEEGNISGNSYDMLVVKPGLYILQVAGESAVYNKKILIN